MENTKRKFVDDLSTFLPPSGTFSPLHLPLPTVLEKCLEKWSSNRSYVLICSFFSSSTFFTISKLDTYLVRRRLATRLIRWSKYFLRYGFFLPWSSNSSFSFLSNSVRSSLYIPWNCDRKLFFGLENVRPRKSREKKRFILVFEFARRFSVKNVYCRNVLRSMNFFTASRRPKNSQRERCDAIFEPLFVVTSSNRCQLSFY